MKTCKSSSLASIILVGSIGRRGLRPNKSLKGAYLVTVDSIYRNDYKALHKTSSH